MRFLLLAVFLPIIAAFHVTLPRIRSSKLQSYNPPAQLPLSPFVVDYNIANSNLKQYLSNVIDIVREAALPTNLDELLSIFIAEAIAGFVGGLVSRFVAYLIGDRKKDTSLLDGTTAGSFFAIKSITMSLASGIGLPLPISRVLSGLIASLISEFLKIFGRSSELTLKRIEKKDIDVKKQLGFKNGTGSEKKTTDSKKDMKVAVSIAEIVQDITKWIIYGVYLPSNFDNEFSRFFVVAKLGAISSIAGFFMFELINYNSNKVEKAREKIVPLLQSTIEGAVLFITYEYSIDILEKYTSPELRLLLSKKFVEHFRCR